MLQTNPHICVLSYKGSTSDFGSESRGSNPRRTTMKAISKNIEVDYLKWTDNLHEMKVFCSCVITYESCCIDDYYSLTIYDDIRENDVIVPLGNYVIKFNNILTHVDPETFELLFEITSCNQQSDQNEYPNT